MQIEQLERLKDVAIPIDDADGRSDRQRDAEEVFYNAVRETVGEEDFVVICNIMNNCLMATEEALVFAYNCAHHGLDYVIEALNIDESMMQG